MKKLILLIVINVPSFIYAQLSPNDPGGGGETLWTLTGGVMRPTTLTAPLEIERLTVNDNLQALSEQGFTAALTLSDSGSTVVGNQRVTGSSLTLSGIGSSFFGYNAGNTTLSGAGSSFFGAHGGTISLTAPAGVKGSILGGHFAGDVSITKDGSIFMGNFNGAITTGVGHGLVGLGRFSSTHNIVSSGTGIIGYSEGGTSTISGIGSFAQGHITNILTFSGRSSYGIGDFNNITLTGQSSFAVGRANIVDLNGLNSFFIGEYGSTPTISLESGQFISASYRGTSGIFIPTGSVTATDLMLRSSNTISTNQTYNMSNSYLKVSFPNAIGNLTLTNDGNILDLIYSGSVIHSGTVRESIIRLVSPAAAGYTLSSGDSANIVMVTGVSSGGNPVLVTDNSGNNTNMILNPNGLSSIAGLNSGTATIGDDSVQVTVTGLSVNSIIVATYVGNTALTTEVPLQVGNKRTDGFTIYGTDGKVVNYWVARR